MLWLAAKNLLFFQYIIDLQLSSHIMNKKDKYKMKEILKKRVLQCCKEFKRKFLIK